MLNKRILPLMILIITFFIWAISLFYKYDHLGYYDWDLAFFTQACWQLLHGSQFTSVTGINYFGDHSYLITFLYLPFFALAPHPLTLVFVKLIAFLMAAYLFYRIAFESLGQYPAVALMIVYIIFPANIFSILYEFNPESLAPPILFWMFSAFKKEQWRSFVWASVFLILLKENMAMIVCAFALYGIFTRKCPPKIAWPCLLVSALFLYISVIFIIPHFRHLSYHPFVVRYAYLGKSIGEIAFNLFTHPIRILRVILSVHNREYIQSLFGPLLVPALFSWQVLFFIFPLLLQHLLSIQAPEHSIHYHYGATIAPFIFLALLQTLYVCSQRFKARIFASVMALLLAISCLDFSDHLNIYALYLDHHHDDLSSARWAFIDAVPPQEPIIATFDFLAPLSLRKDLYAFHKVYDDSFQNPADIKLSELNTGGSFVLPGQVHYALIDFSDPWLQSDLANNPSVRLRVDAFLKGSQWKIIKSCESMVLLKR